MESEVLVVLDMKTMTNKAAFDEYILKEGFKSVENEPFAYIGVSTTPVFNVIAYIFEVFSKAFETAGVEECRLICQIGSHPPAIYIYKKDEFFTALK
ncbi:MAG: hypothetical protein LBF71_01070 [Campylobacteraceae bacterium]|jgi:hypothetical protein|nr:hypothetical protein [Campylobacteraceae bacterium]